MKIKVRINSIQQILLLCVNVFVFAKDIFLNVCINNYFINNNMNVKHELDMFLSVLVRFIFALLLEFI